jgi:hypothetical protein
MVRKAWLRGSFTVYCGIFYGQRMKKAASGQNPDTAFFVCNGSVETEL